MSESTIATAVTVKEMTGNTCEFFIGKKRAGYVGYGTPAPINWINSNASGLGNLKTEERMAVVKKVREIMAGKTKEREDKEGELAKLEAGEAPGEQEEVTSEAPAKKKTAKK